MHFIYDVYSLPYGSRGIYGFIADGANIFNAVVGGGVKFNHIQYTAAVYTKTGGTGITRIPAGRMLAVYAFCKYFGTGSFASAAGTGKKIRMRETIKHYLALESFRYMFLTNNVVKCAWTPFPIQSLIQISFPPFDEMRTAHNRAAHPSLIMQYVRYLHSLLGNGSLAAHEESHLMLLGSPPDMVREHSLRKTVSSTPLMKGRRHIDKTGDGNSSLL